MLLAVEHCIWFKNQEDLDRGLALNSGNPTTNGYHGPSSSYFLCVYSEVRLIEDLKDLAHINSIPLPTGFRWTVIPSSLQGLIRVEVER